MMNALDRIRTDNVSSQKSRVRGLWTKVRVVVILNQLLNDVRKGERREKIDHSEILQIEFVPVSGEQIRNEIRRVQQKFIAPAVIDKSQVKKRRKSSVYLFLSDPRSSRAALVFQFFMFALILTSISAFIASTCPRHAGKASLDVIEMVCQIIFTVEYVTKISCAPKPVKAMLDPLNIVDLVSILPWYIEIGMSGLRIGSTQEQTASGASSARVLRIFRLFRIVKVFRLGSRAKKVQVIAVAVANSSDMFLVLCFLLVLGLVMFSAVIYFFEKNQMKPIDAEQANEINNFDSIPRSFWWCIVTLMTVGYGDAVPLSIGGKIVGSITMLGSVLITALPISVIGANFTQQWLDYKGKEERKTTRLNINGKSRFVVKEMYSYARVLTALTDHVGALENQIMQEVGELRVILTAIVRMSKTCPVEDIKIACGTFDARFKRLEDLREGLEDLQATYDLLSHSDFAVALQQIKTAGIKMQKLEESGGILDKETEVLIKSTAGLRSQLFTLKDGLSAASSQQALEHERAQNEMYSFRVSKSDATKKRTNTFDSVT